MNTIYEGRLERFEQLTIIGWAVNSNDPLEIFDLGIYIDDVYFCNVKNDGSRLDLLKHGKSRGKKEE